MKMLRPAIVLLLAAFLVTTASCGSGEKDVPGSRGKITVVTTLFPLYDFTRVIAGDRATVTLILPPGVEPHAFEPKPGDMARVNTAQLFVYTGKYMEPWAEQLLKGVANKTLVVTDASRGIRLMKSGGGHHESETGEHGHGHHHHGTYDPHIWLDPENAMKMVDTITDGLCAADPPGSDLFRKNAAVYKQRLSTLHGTFRETLGTCKKKTLIHGGHFAFGYLAHRYGLEYISAYEGSPNSEPTARKIIALKKKMGESGIRYVYFEELINPKVSELLSRETGATLLYLHGAHNLTKDEFEKGATFISLMENNLENLRKGLECR
jgi:zinc transport system substrate-binding protein